MRRIARFGIAATLPVLATVACQTDSASVTRSSETIDSAGIEVVTNHRPHADSSGWVIPDVPLTTLGGPGSELHRVRAAIRLDSARILVAARTELTIYDTAGRIVAKAGGAGDGPGEFRSISAVAVNDDGTIHVWDGLFYRSFYSTDLQHLKKEALDAGLMRRIAPYGGAPMPTGNNSVVISAMQMEAAEPARGDVFRAGYLHALLNLDSGTVDTLLKHPGGFAEVYLGNRQSNGVFFSPRYHITVSRAGHAFITDGAEFEIREFDPSGKLSRIIRRSGSPRRVTEREAETEKMRRRAMLERSRPDLNVEQSFALLPDPAVFPAMDDLDADSEGYIWAREPVGPHDERATWAVFSPRGVWLGNVTAPIVLDLLDAGPDYVLGLSRDELDREYVHLFALRRAGR